MPRRPAVVTADHRPATESDALAFWCGTKRRMGFAQGHKGRSWHVRNAKGQALADLPDVLMVLPRPTPPSGVTRPDLTVVLEIKINRDRLSDGQRDALARFARAGAVALVCRYGATCQPGEYTQDECVAIIEAVLRGE